MCSTVSSSPATDSTLTDAPFGIVALETEVACHSSDFIFIVPEGAKGSSTIPMVSCSCLLLSLNCFVVSYSKMAAAIMIRIPRMMYVHSLYSNPIHLDSSYVVPITSGPERLWNAFSEYEITSAFESHPAALLSQSILRLIFLTERNTPDLYPSPAGR